MSIFKMKPPRWVYLIFLIGMCSITMRFILDTRFGTTSLTYVLIPFIISFLIYHFLPPPEGSTHLSGVARHFYYATVIMLGTSAIIFEGFICVLFFMPIYYAGVAIALAFARWRDDKDRAEKNKFKASVIPLLVIISAVEGLSPSTSFERHNSVTQQVIINADIDTLKTNMTQEIILPTNRHWMLGIFPLPQDIQAGSLNTGDIHKMSFTYKRWFFTNVKTGEFHLRLDGVKDNHIKTSVIKNDSYLAGYMDIKGTDINFKAITPTQTHVTLTIHYDRRLDPYWYFGPLQKFTVEKSAVYLIDSIIARNAAWEAQ